ncbi:hypothetical protein ACWC0D_32730, partial [Streptomyces sp. NPDC001719]
ATAKDTQSEEAATLGRLTGGDPSLLRHQAVRARRHFPSETAALQCVYLAVISLDPTGTRRKRWTSHWKQALQAFDITFNGRLTHNHISTQQPYPLHQNPGLRV